MDINDFQKDIIKAFDKMKKVPGRKEHTKQSAMIHLTEEIGEIARQITSEYHRPKKFDKENLGEEIADAMMFLVLIANMYQIDLSQKMKKSAQKVSDKARELFSTDA